MDDRELQSVVLACEAGFMLQNCAAVDDQQKKICITSLDLTPAYLVEAQKYVCPGAIKVAIPAEK